MGNYYNYSSTYSRSVDPDALLAVSGGFLIFTIIFTIALSVISIIAMWKIFTKAGKPGWAAIIPVYNMVVLFQIAGMNPLLLLLALIPFANFIILPILTILMNIKLAQKFGKSGGFAVGLIFLNFIFMLILAFGDAQYQG